MEKLKDEAEGCDAEFKPIIAGLQDLHKAYTRFTDLALAPEKKGNLAKYCGDYIFQKNLTAIFFDSWVKRVSQVKEPPKSQERWDTEYETALTALRARYPQYRRMPLRFATHPVVRMQVRRWHLWRARASDDE